MWTCAPQPQRIREYGTKKRELFHKTCSLYERSSVCACVCVQSMKFGGGWIKYVPGASMLGALLGESLEHLFNISLREKKRAFMKGLNESSPLFFSRSSAPIRRGKQGGEEETPGWRWRSCDRMWATVCVIGCRVWIISTGQDFAKTYDSTALWSDWLSTAVILC